MSQTLKSVREFYDEAPPTDISELFETWMELVDGLKAKVADRFELTRDPSTEPLEAFGGENGGPTGRIRGYAGPEIDWMIHSHMENAKLGFANIHLTIWLGPQVKVPHFGLALGAFPQAWIFVDSVPRTNLLTDTESYDKYYGPLNSEWEQLQQDNDFLAPFVSRSGFVRASLSPMAHAYTAPTDGRTTEVVTKLATDHLDRWLGWVDEALKVPADERAALAADDLATRRNVAERDPANEMGDRFFGKELTNTLVRALWGGDRQLPRAHEWS